MNARPPPERGAQFGIASNNVTPELGRYYVNADGRVCFRDPNCLTDVVMFKEGIDGDAAHDFMKQQILRVQNPSKVQSDD
jgi:hypothetical protein